jgi:hypothetical protein
LIFILFAAFKSVSLNFPSNFSANDRQLLADFNASMNRRIVKLEELDVSIDEVDTVDLLLGLFTSCRNIKKFTLYNYDQNTHEFPQTVRLILSIFTQLEELSIITSCSLEGLNEVFDAISSNCPNLQILGVRRSHVSTVENYFRNRDLMIIAYEDSEWSDIESESNGSVNESNGSDNESRDSDSD